jgi:branched-chain amino acid transport system permease protein
MNDIKTLQKKPSRSRLATIVALAGLVVTLAVCPTLFGPYVTRILSLSAIYAICALSMNMVNGFTGLFSLGQPGFMAIGAYTVALLTVTPADKQAVFYMTPIAPALANVHTSFAAALLIGAALAAVAAFLVSFPVLRLQGDYLAIATLGFSEIIRIVFQNSQSVSNGALGINKIPTPAIDLHIGGTRIYIELVLWISFAILILIIVFMLRLMKTSWGRAFKSIREDETAAQAMGINLFKHKMIAFVLSGFIAGLSGGLLAVLVAAVSPDQFKFVLAYNILLMVVLGGQGSISGSVVGAFVITIAQELLRFIDQPFKVGFISYPGVDGMRMVVFSALLMYIILFWSRGIFGSEEFSWHNMLTFFRRIGQGFARIGGFFRELFGRGKSTEGGAK